MSVNPDRVTPTVGPYWVTGIQGEVKNMSAQLTPDSATGYSVNLDGHVIGRVYRPWANERTWAHHNEANGWYGTHRTQREAIAALIDLATRKEAK